jgi:KipI family sensor histidine kinase inhibitor
MEIRWLDAGDGAVTVEFGSTIDTRLVAAVSAFDAAITRAREAGSLPGLVETMPTFRSLTVFYDPLATSRQRIEAQLRPLLAAAPAENAAVGRHWRLPVCYEGDAAPDLAEAARATGLPESEVVALHSGVDYRVYMLGFLPGFPFMGDLPEPLRLPRRTQPRVRVPAGSVAIATGLTAIYPWESPGGWHLLGRCPLPLFDVHRPAPSLLSPGDRVRFVPVPRTEHDRLAAAARDGSLDVAAWQDDAVEVST